MTYTTDFIPLNIAVLTVSDTRNEATDSSGKLLVEKLTEAGHRLHEKTMVTDDVYRIRAIVSRWIADESAQVVLINGGTGITGRDVTPEAVAPLLDKQIEGFGEMFRYLSFEEIQTSALQSRALAGVANGCYIFCLPGSTGACRTGWDKIIQYQLDSRNQPCNLAMLVKRLREK